MHKSLTYRRERYKVEKKLTKLKTKKHFLNQIKFDKRAKIKFDSEKQNGGN